MSSTAISCKRKNQPVTRVIRDLKKEMDATGKYYLICGICGRKGPKFAEKDLLTGRLVVSLDGPGLDKWRIRVVAKDSLAQDKKLSWSGFNGQMAAYTTIRICPICARKEH